MTSFDEVDDKIYVALSKNWKACKSSLEWAIRNSIGKKLCLVHVHQPAQYICILGGKFPINLLSEQQVTIHQEEERQEMRKVLDEYIQICTKAGVKVETLHIEMETVESGLVELISQHKIERLVMGAAADSSYSRKMMEPKSKKASYVQRFAPAFCQIWFTCKGHLIYTRESIKLACLHDKEIDVLPNNILRCTLSTSSRRMEFEESFDQSSTFSLSQLSIFYRSSEITSDSTLCDSKTENKEPSFRSYILSHESEEKLHHLPCTNLLGEEIDDPLYYELDQAIAEAEFAKQEALKESARRREAEKDATAAIDKANAAESFYHEELRRREELEVELAKTKENLEQTKKERDMALDELNSWFQSLMSGSNSAAKRPSWEI